MTSFRAFLTLSTQGEIELPDDEDYPEEYPEDDEDDLEDLLADHDEL